MIIKSPEDLTEFGKVYLSILEEWVKRGTSDFKES